MTSRNQSLDVLRGIAPLFFIGFLLALHILTGDVTARASGLAGLCLWCGFRPTDDRRAKLFLCSFFVLILTIAILPVLAYTNHSNQLKYDNYLHAIDHSLGFCPAEWFARSIHWSSLLTKLTVGLYQLLPTMMVAGYGWALYRTKESNRLLCTYLLAPVSALLYLIVPASGPGFLLGPEIFENHIAESLSLVPLHFAANCIPSMHLTWSLQMALNSRFRFLRSVYWAYASLITVATIALGEHYLIDLIAAVPYTWIIQKVLATYPLPYRPTPLSPRTIAQSEA